MTGWYNNSRWNIIPQDWGGRDRSYNRHDGRGRYVIGRKRPYNERNSRRDRDRPYNERNSSRDTNSFNSSGAAQITISEVHIWLLEQQPFVLKTLIKTCCELLLKKYKMNITDLRYLINHPPLNENVLETPDDGDIVLTESNNSSSMVDVEYSKAEESSVKARQLIQNMTNRKSPTVGRDDISRASILDTVSSTVRRCRPISLEDQVDTVAKGVTVSEVYGKSTSSNPRRFAEDRQHSIIVGVENNEYSKSTHRLDIVAANFDNGLLKREEDNSLGVNYNKAI